MFTPGFLVNVLEDQPLEGEADGLTKTINHSKCSSVLVGLRWSAFLWRKRLILTCWNTSSSRGGVAKLFLKEPDSKCQEVWSLTTELYCLHGDAV